MIDYVNLRGMERVDLVASAPGAPLDPMIVVYSFG